MLMNDKQVAVSDVILRLLEASDYYTHAADVLSDPDLAGRFATRGRDCREAAGVLEPHLRRLGELPPRPDPEREALDQVLKRIAAIGVDERHRFAESLRERESAIEEAAGAALRQPLPDDTLQELRHIEAAAREQAAELGQLAQET